jgi:hypothetical protein
MATKRIHKDPEKNKEYSPFETVECFNKQTKKLFMSDPLASRMFYFVYNNFLEYYVKLINQKYQKRIAASI